MGRPCAGSPSPSEAAAGGTCRRAAGGRGPFLSQPALCCWPVLTLLSWPPSYTACRTSSLPRETVTLCFPFFNHYSPRTLNLTYLHQSFIIFFR